MARPPLPLGTWGEIRTYYRHDGQWRPEKTLPDDLVPDAWKACAQFRDFDGKTRQVERTGTTKPKAIRALREGLKARAGNKPAATLTASSRVHHAITLYLDDIRQNRAGTTYDRYEGQIRNYSTVAVVKSPSTMSGQMAAVVPSEPNRNANSRPCCRRRSNATRAVMIF